MADAVNSSNRSRFLTLLLFVIYEGVHSPLVLPQLVGFWNVTYTLLQMAPKPRWSPRPSATNNRRTPFLVADPPSPNIIISSSSSRSSSSSSSGSS